MAPYDYAWMKFFRYMHNQKLDDAGAIKIRLNSIYNEKWKQSKIALQLYFVKIFGCRVVEYDIPSIKIALLSNSLLNFQACPGFYLSFYKWGARNYKWGARKKLDELHLSDIHKTQLQQSNDCFFQFMYSAGHFAVEVIYFPTMPKAGELSGFNYHPEGRRDKYIIVSDIATPPS